jgi:deoxyuridine 5'-triphosphate nucleotidohydrolase
MKLKIKRINNGQLPNRAYQYDAGWDCFANESVVLPPLRYMSGYADNHTLDELRNDAIPTIKVPLGFAMELPPGYVAILKDRGSLGSKGIHVSAGVCDAAYRGEYLACLTNHTSHPIQINKGDKIIQMIILKLPETEIEEVEELGPSERGEQGFGSSGG